MTTKNYGLAQQPLSSLSAEVSSGGRRPKGETSAESPQNKPSSMPDVQVNARQRAPRRTFSTSYKLNVLEDYEACDNALARGALLRKEGLYHARLSSWRKQRDDGKLSVNAKGKTPKLRLMNQQLARENSQLKKKLTQAEAIIDLQKKISELLGTHILPTESSEKS